MAKECCSRHWLKRGDNKHDGKDTNDPWRNDAHMDMGKYCITDEWDICDPIWDDDGNKWQTDCVNIEWDDELVWPLDVQNEDSMKYIKEDNIIALSRHMSTQIAEQEFKEKPIIALKIEYQRNFMTTYTYSARRKQNYYHQEGLMTTQST